MKPKKMVNICVIGPTSCGKTAIVLRLIYNIFPTDHDPTIDDWYTKVFRGHRFQFRDTSGLMTEPEKGLRKSSLKDSHLILLVYDASDPQSLNHLSMFANELKQLDRDPHVLVVANKCEKVNEMVRENGMQFAMDNKWQHVSVSAKMDYQITHLLYLICQTPVDERESGTVEPMTQNTCCCIL